jgi:hypothetical protein
MTTGSNRGWVPSRRSCSPGSNDEVSTYATAGRSRPELTESSPDATSPPEVGRAPEHRGEAGIGGVWPRMGGEIRVPLAGQVDSTMRRRELPRFTINVACAGRGRPPLRAGPSSMDPAMTIVISWRP